MASIGDIISKHRPDLGSFEGIYKHIHSHPELAFNETETAKTIVKTLAAHSQPQVSNGYAVQEKIGVTGVAAVLSNGAGPTVMLRADMDALPIEEATGLDYASTQRGRDMDGKEQPIMHACGHDMHVTSLLAASELLFRARDAWRGTLVLVFQPAEEKGKGAKAMVEGGLYTSHGGSVPIPDIVLGGHVTVSRAGSVSSRPGLLLGAADSFRVQFTGRGAHASAPHLAIDPVLSAAQATVRLQSLVSRTLDPLSQGGVVTVASIQAGYGENVIPSHAEMKIDVRSGNEAMRKTLVDGVHRVLKAEAAAAGMEKAVGIERMRDFPITWNDPEMFEKLGQAMHAHFGDDWSDDAPLVSASEDFTVLATSVKRPSVFWWYGGYTAEYLQKMKDEGRESEIPYNHSPHFAPVIQPTLKAAMEAYAVAALTWLGRP